jgi:hypothetical protein
VPFNITITPSELKLLEELRLERLRGFFTQSLSRLPIYIDRHNGFNIFCPNSSIFNTLLFDIENLRNQAWLILGVKTVSIYLVEKQDWVKVCNHIWLN